MTKRITAVFMAVLMFLTIMPLSAIAANIGADKKISEIFPDSIFAQHIADKLSVNVDTVVSQERLDEVTSVNPSGAVHSVEGIQYLNSLTEARLDNLQLTDRFPDEFVSDMQPNLNFYIANNQRYTSDRIYLSSASFGEVYPHIPPLFNQYAQYNPGKVIGTWYIINSFGGVINQFDAIDGTELLDEYSDISDGNSYTLRLVQDKGNAWMGLNNSQYDFPITFDTSNNGGKVEGTVTYSGSGAPVALATIKLYADNTYQSVTNNAGYYVFGNVKPGNYTITCEYPGYKTISSSANVSAKRTTVVDFVLEEEVPQASVVGKVIDKVTREPLENVKITPSLGMTQETIKYTDANGEFYYSNIPEGSYSTLFEKTGYQNYTDDRTIQNGMSAEVLIEMIPVTFTLSGTVTDRDTTAPIGGATVKVETEFGELTATTDANGEYVISGLPEGTYTVTASADDYSTEAGEVTISGADETLDFQLTNNPGTVVVNAKYKYAGSSADGTAAPEVMLNIIDIDMQHPGTHEQDALTDENGTYSFTMASGHEYKLKVAKKGYNVNIVKINGADVAVSDEMSIGTLTANGEIVVDVEVEPIMVDLTGTVYIDDNPLTNTPIEGALVELEVLSEGTLPYAGSTSYTTLANGEYEFLSVPVGEYRILAGKDPAYSTEVEIIETDETSPSLVVTDFYLKENPAHIIGRVLYFGTEQPVMGAKLFMKDDSNNEIRAEITNAAGEADAYVSAGTYSGWAEYDGYTAPVQTFTVESLDEEVVIFYVYEEDTNALAGLVTDYITDEPIEVFEIELSQNGVPVDPVSFDISGGNYLSTHLTAGTYQMTVSADKYYSQTREVEVSASGITYEDFRLVPFLSDIQGSVKYKDGSSINGANLKLYYNSVEQSDYTTDGSGTYEFNDISVGKYTVTCEVNGVTQSKDVETIEGTISIVDFVFENEPGQIIGKVKNETTNVEIQNADIRAYPTSDLGTHLDTATDVSGDYELNNVPAENYFVTATADGYVTRVEKGVVQSGQIERVDFLLTEKAAEPGILMGKVIFTPANTPVEGATITVSKVGEPDVVLTTDENGEYFVRLEEGEYTVNMTYGTSSQEKTVNIESTLTTEANFEIYTGGGGGGGDEPDEHKLYIKGYTDGNFHPHAFITRAEAATIIARVAFDDYVEGQRYDIGDGYADENIDKHWAISAIEFTTLKGVFSGYKGNYFRPNQTITREEFAVAFSRISGAEPAGDMPFTDTDKISAWAKDGVYTAYINGWMSGDSEGTFRPDVPINRAEAVKTINSYLRRGVDKAGVGSLNIKKWPDVAETHWAYYEIIEASNSHSYEYRNNTGRLENWVSLK